METWSFKLLQVRWMPNNQRLKNMEVVNRNPSFGSSLLNDNFGQRPAADDLKALNPLDLQAADDASEGVTETINFEAQSSLEPLLQNDGATQMFTDMHGIQTGLEDGDALDRPGAEAGVSAEASLTVGAPVGIEQGGVLDRGPARTEMRHMAGLTVSAQRLGATDWGSGTDGGRSGKPQDGVPYGCFAGV